MLLVAVWTVDVLLVAVCAVDMLLAAVWTMQSVNVFLVAVSDSWAECGCVGCQVTCDNMVYPRPPSISFTFCFLCHFQQLK